MANAASSIASGGSPDLDADPASPVGTNTNPKFYNERSFMTNAPETEDEDHSKMATTEPGQNGPNRRIGRRAAAQAAANTGPGKIKHLKKADGEPLWRVDIQYDFLKAIFEDEQAVFTNSWEPKKPKQTFADLYVDTMSRSSKTSKVLRDKLLTDREAAKNMAMVCLLVNIGRMNTTLNFFPEMRAQLRTYHAIPSLQAGQDVANQYKQLQDAPRLKSILKGGTDDRPEPQSLDTIKELQVPRTNPVSLLFVICNSSAKVAELHFPREGDFSNLIMRTDLSSKSRARAFLWIMWFYLESDFTEEGCQENPFGEGVDYGLDVANQGVPRMEPLTQEQEEAENVDTPEEVLFGTKQKATRKQIIEADEQYALESNSKRGSRARMVPAGDEGSTMGVLPRIRPSKHESDMDSTRSTPPRAHARHKEALAGSNRRTGAPLKYQIFEGSSPGGPQMIEGIIARKPRPPTAHQLAVERNRSARVEYILDRGIRKAHREARKARKREGAVVRAYRRVGEMEIPFEDSEGEDNIMALKHHLLVGPTAYPPGVDPISGKKMSFRERGMGGLVSLVDEPDDFGEEFAAINAALRRTVRRLDRWELQTGHDVGPVAPVKRPRPSYLNGERDPDETEEEDRDADATQYSMMDDSMLAPPAKSRHRHINYSNGMAASSNGEANMDDVDAEDDLNDVDKELLGLASENGDGDEEELDDLELTMLGRKEVASDSE